MFELADMKWGNRRSAESGGKKPSRWNRTSPKVSCSTKSFTNLRIIEDAMRSAFDAWEDVADIKLDRVSGRPRGSGWECGRLDEEIIGIARTQRSSKLPGTRPVHQRRPLLGLRTKEWARVRRDRPINLLRRRGA